MLGYPILSMRSIPQGPRVPRPLLRGATSKAGRIESAARGQRRVAGELLGQHRAEGVGGEVRRAPPERRRARPVVASSAATTRRPTASSTRIIDVGKTPYSALHDIDANKPGGSIKIRVKTYAHALKLHEERLEDTAQAQGRARRSRIDEKRLELLELKRQQLAARKQQDPALEQHDRRAQRARSRAYSAPVDAASPRARRPRALVQLGKKTRRRQASSASDVVAHV